MSKRERRSFTKEYKAEVVDLVLVEVDGEKPTCLVLEERIDTDDVAPLQVIAHDAVGHGKEGLIRAFAALDARLLAQSRRPLVRAGWRVPALPRTWIAPVSREDVGTTAKQASEESDLLRRRVRGGSQRISTARDIEVRELPPQSGESGLRFAALRRDPRELTFLTLDLLNQCCAVGRGLAHSERVLAQLQMVCRPRGNSFDPGHALGARTRPPTPRSTCVRGSSSNPIDR